MAAQVVFAALFLALLIGVQCLEGREGDWPQVKLRTRTIDKQNEAHRCAQDVGTGLASIRNPPRRSLRAGGLPAGAVALAAGAAAAAAPASGSCRGRQDDGSPPPPPPICPCPRRLRRLHEAPPSPSPPLPPPPRPHHHTSSERWGTLRRAQQFLLTHRPGLQHEEQLELLQHVEAAGCHVAHYIPDHSMVVVGPAAALQRVQQHQHVLWMVRVRGCVRVWRVLGTTARRGLGDRENVPHCAVH